MSFMASMEVVAVTPHVTKGAMFSVAAASGSSTLRFDTPWPPKVGDFLIVEAKVPGER